MKNKTRNRVLAFERLESKATPSNLLLILAPLDDATHVHLESAQQEVALLDVRRGLTTNHAHCTSSSGTQLGRDVESARVMIPETDTSANWQITLSTSELLRFVEANTHRSDVDSFASPTPTVDHCRCADEMMRLEDVDVRTLVIAESLDV